jgi:hypothetical protein
VKRPLNRGSGCEKAFASVDALSQCSKAASIRSGLKSGQLDPADHCFLGGATPEYSEYFQALRMQNRSQKDDALREP